MGSRWVRLSSHESLDDVTFVNVGFWEAGPSDPVVLSGYAAKVLKPPDLSLFAGIWLRRLPNHHSRRWAIEAVRGKGVRRGTLDDEAAAQILRVLEDRASSRSRDQSGAQASPGQRLDPRAEDVLIWMLQQYELGADLETTVFRYQLLAPSADAGRLEHVGLGTSRDVHRGDMVALRDARLIRYLYPRFRQQTREPEITGLLVLARRALAYRGPRRDPDRH